MREKILRVLASTGLIVVAAFVVRMACLAIFYRYYGEPALHDMRFGGEAGSIAEAIATGRGFSSPLYKFPSGPTAWLAPVFPYLLATVFKLFGTFTYSSGLVIRTIDLALSAATCWPICAIGSKVFSKAVGKAAGWAWVFCPSAVSFSLFWVWDTALAGLWMAMLFALSLQLRGSRRLSAWIGYGALWAVGALINPSLLTVLPFMALWAIWPLRTQLKRAALLAGAASLIFFAGISPWIIRNYVVFHQFIPLRSNFGLELWLGNNSEGLDTPISVMLLHPGESLVEGPKYVEMTEIPYMQEKTRDALFYMRSHPAETARAIFLRFVDNWLGMWDPPVDVWRSAPLYFRATIVWNCLFSLLSLLGVLIAYRKRNDEAKLFAAVILTFPVIFYVTHSSLRYRFPMDPLMQVLAAYAVVYPTSHLVTFLKKLSAGRMEAGAPGTESSTSFGTSRSI